MKSVFLNFRTTQITEYQNSVDEEKRLRLEHEEKIAELEEQNNALQAEIEHLQKVSYKILLKIVILFIFSKIISFRRVSLMWR